MFYLPRRTLRRRKQIPRDHAHVGTLAPVVAPHLQLRRQPHYPRFKPPILGVFRAVVLV